MLIMIRPPVGPVPFSVFASGCFIRDTSTEPPVFRYTRIGPFVPPVMFPSVNKVFVRDDVKVHISNAIGAAASYSRVIVVKWVYSNWQGEDANYLVESLNVPLDVVEFFDDAKHDLKLEQTMPAIWEIDPRTSITASEFAEEDSSFRTQDVNVRYGAFNEDLGCYRIRVGKQQGSRLVFSERLWSSLGKFRMSTWCSTLRVGVSR